MSVQGTDQRTLVTDWSPLGLRSVVSIDAVSTLPTATVARTPAVGSGIMVAETFVLTAGHVVFDSGANATEAGGRVTDALATTGVPPRLALPSRPTTGLTPTDINWRAGDVTYPDDYDTSPVFDRDIALIEIDASNEAAPIAMMAFANPLTATGYAITTAGFPAGVVPGSGSVNAGVVVGTTASGNQLTEAILGYQASGSIASATAAGRMSYTNDVDTEGGQSGSGVWTMVDDGTGTGTMTAAVLGVHTSGGSSNGGHLITMNEYADIAFWLEFGLTEAEIAALPRAFLIGATTAALTPTPDDYIQGSGLREVIRLQDGDDRAEGAGGDDRIEGGAGVDQALFSDVITDYDLTITDATDPDRPNLTIAHARGTQFDGTDTTTGVEFAVFEYEDLDGDGADDDGLQFFVPLLADLDDPTKLRDGPDVTYVEDVLDVDGNRLGAFSAEVPAFMFDGDVEYSFAVGASSTLLYNIVYIVDSSGSMSGTPIAETKAAFAALTNFLSAEGIAQRTNFAVVDFDSSSRLFPNLDAAGAIAAVNSLVAGGGTSFGPALVSAEGWFESIPVTARTNIAYFLSDGFGSGASPSLQLVNEGLPNEAVVDVRAFGIGAGADLVSLNLIDSDNAVILSDASQLTGAFAVSGFDRDIIERIDVRFNGAVIETIDPATLADGPLGLTHEGTISGLEVTRDADNRVFFDLIFNDGTPTATIESRITTGQTEVRTQSADGTSFVVTFAVNQADYGGAAENESVTANDLANRITTGAGTNTIDAQGGDDVITITPGSINVIDGGDDTDTVIFLVDRATAGAISRSGDVLTIGEQTLVNVEFVEFTDGRIDAVTLAETALMSFADPRVTVSEADAGTVAASFVLTLANAATQEITVDFATRDDTATAGADYVATTGSVTFGIGQSAVTVTVDISPDAEVEGLESFFLDATIQGGATFADGGTTATATGLIEDDDSRIGRLNTGDDDAIVEGSSGGTTFFDIVLERTGDLSGEDVIGYGLATAENGGVAYADAADFVGGFPPPGQVTFAAGESTATITLEIAADRRIEADEIFEMQFSAISGSATLDLPSAVFTILNDDPGEGLIRGSGGPDNLIGTGGNDVIRGFRGRDLIIGRRGDDDLDGGAGPDWVIGRAGDDTIRGGGGNDKLRGGQGDDLIDGESGNDRMKGGGGEDTIFGGDGDDKMFGGGKADLLSGDAGNDTLVGQAGEDTLDGGTGDDVLDGGAQADLFVFEEGDGRDVIRDFQNGKDRIQFLSGAASFEDLEITREGARTLIEYGDGDVIVLRGTRPWQVDEGDFVFGV